MNSVVKQGGGNASKVLHNSSKNCVRRYSGERYINPPEKIQQISCFKPIEEYSRLPVDTIKEYYKKEIALQMAEEILKHPEFFKLTDTGFGYKYDLAIVKIE